MNNSSLRHLPLLVSLCFTLSACKKEVPAPPTTNTASTSEVAIPAATQATAVQPPGSAAPNTSKTDAGIEPPVIPFDFNTVPEASGKIPPFPYLDYPPKVGQGLRWTYSWPMDRVWVILGDHLHAVEGRVETRTFSHSDADMSELEVRRNYENAMRDIGAVKVNTVDYKDPAVLAAASGDDYKLRKKLLRIPDLRMSYDVYLARKGERRHWIVVMSNDSDTSILSIEEQPFAYTIGYEGSASTPVTAAGKPALAPQPLDVNAIPVNSASLPPFPYLAYPPAMHKAHYNTDKANFDAVKLIVGKEIRTVEGRYESRSFSNKLADMSQMALRRNYEAAVKGLGGVKVNTVAPEDKELLAANTNDKLNEYALRKQMHIPDRNMSYDSYLVRTPETNVWLVLMFGEDDVSLLTVEEKAMQQSIALVTADTIRKELDAKGKIALYINFDTDKAAIRPDGKPAVDEITKLLKADSSLKLAIEGHTDNSGDAARNQALSTQRAEAVVQTLVKDGIDAKRLRAAGHGADKPLADNKDEAGRAKNRRVELIKL